jgi:hypothetical protein
MRRLAVAALAAASILALASPAGATLVQIDPNQPDPSYSKSEAMTVGTPIATTIGTPATPVRGFLANCTVTGNVNITLADGSTFTLTGLPVGLFILPLVVKEVNSSGTTATCTYRALG